MLYVKYLAAESSTYNKILNVDTRGAKIIFNQK